MQAEPRGASLEAKVEALTAVVEVRLEALAETVDEHKKEVTEHIRNHTEAHIQGANRAHQFELEISNKLTMIEQSLKQPTESSVRMEQRITSLETTIRIMKAVGASVIVTFLSLLGCLAAWLNFIVKLMESQK